MVTLFAILFILICPLIIFIVLVQDPKGGGLAGVLGGAGGGSAFGAKTADVVMKTTVVLGIVFFLLAIALGLKLRQSGTITATTLEPEAPAAAEVEGAEEGEAAEEAAEETTPAAEGTEGEAEPVSGGAEAAGAAAEAPAEPAGAEESAERAPPAAARD
ncbi:MAG: preprotein translocase subunit SecG [Planctomycetota bacterium]|jgi:preprotein translocase subunit SecG